MEFQHNNISESRRLQGAIMTSASFCALISMFLLGCYPRMFDPSEKLPTYPGINSELHVLQGIAAASHGPINPPDGQANDLIMLYQTVENNTKYNFRIYSRPAFQVERIIVRDSNGNEVSLSEYGEDMKWAARRRPNGSSTILFPGQSFERSYNLSKLFDLSEPGVYTAEVDTRITMKDGGGIGNYNYYATNPEPVTFEVN